ncbi:MAG TPA: dihydroorotase [Candidatus Margulisiibacteriota bacterium]|nr:dihydroorotase [Candidatus Margulisiibacteriota bacterium]
MSTTIIRGGTVVDPANHLNGCRDLVIQEGVVTAIADANGSHETSDAECIDATGCLVVPGLIDIHVHLREPGYEYKETVETGTRAAVAGGFTAVACMANTNPVNDSAAVTDYIRDKAAAAGLARVFPIGAVSKGLQGEELAEIGEMHRAGIVAVSDDGMPIMNGGLMRRALEYTAMFGLPVIVHEEERTIAADGVMNEGSLSLRLGLKGVPAAAEEAMVGRDIALLERTGGRLHIAHLSTAGSVQLVRAAKQRGLPVTAEVTPHHFTLTEAAVDGYNANAKMNPPLRTQHDVDAVRQGLADGTIDVIATDHAPHHRDEKDVEFDQAANGIVGLETALPLALRLVEETGIPLETIVAALTVNPARVLNLPHGTLSVGAPADVTVIDAQRRWTVEAARFRSKSRNTPFDGMQMQGQAILTMVGGRIVYRAAAGPNA